MKTPAPHSEVSAIDHLLEPILKFARTVARKTAEGQCSDAGSSPAHDSLNPHNTEAILHPCSLLRSRVILKAFVTILLSGRQEYGYSGRQYSQKSALPQGAAFAVRYVSQ